MSKKMPAGIAVAAVMVAVLAPQAAGQGARAGGLPAVASAQAGQGGGRGGGPGGAQPVHVDHAGMWQSTARGAGIQRVLKECV